MVCCFPFAAVNDSSFLTQSPVLSDIHIGLAELAGSLACALPQSAQLQPKPQLRVCCHLNQAVALLHQLSP